jgi:cell division protease FtsH
MALGVTQYTPGADKHLITRPELESRLRYLMGGYASERLVLGQVSSGAENDLQKATDLAFKMVAHYGMGERLGPVFHEHKTEHPFLGQKMATEAGTSDATVHAIEEETRIILIRALDESSRVLTQHRDRLDRLVEALLERETVEKVELHSLLGPSVNASGPGEADALHFDGSTSEDVSGSDRD